MKPGWQIVETQEQIRLIAGAVRMLKWQFSPGGTVITGATGMSQQKNIDFLHMVFEDQRGSFPAPSHGYLPLTCLLPVTTCIFSNPITDGVDNKRVPGFVSLVTIIIL